MSEKPTIVEALSAVMNDVSAVGKFDRNNQHNFSFRGIDAVLNAVGPALRKHGVVVVPLLQSETYGTVEVGQKRTKMSHCRVEVIYRFYGPDGSHIDCLVPGEAMDSGDKSTAKAMSVAFRTALIQALSLPTDETDPDAHVYERSVEPKTDRAWAAEVRGRIQAAASQEVLQRIADEIEAKAEAGGLERADRESLWALGEARFASLAAEQSQAGSQQPRPAPSPDQPAGEAAPPADTPAGRFESRLNAADTLDELDALKTDVMAAFKAQKVDPTDGNKLLKAIREKRSGLEQVAA
jgi:hypothetical protein